MRVVALAVVVAVLVAGCGSAGTSEGSSPPPSAAAASESAIASGANDTPSSVEASPTAFSSPPADLPPSDATEVAARLGCDEVDPLEPGPGDEPAPSSLVSCLLDGSTFTVATYRNSGEVRRVVDQLDDLMGSLTLPGVVGSGENWVVFALPDIDLPPDMQQRVEESGAVLTPVGP